jgi:hypothetical protein
MLLLAPRVAREVPDMSTQWANDRDSYSNGPFAPYLAAERVGRFESVPLKEMGRVHTALTRSKWGRARSTASIQTPT